jgi:hypothetical protein
MVQEFSVLIKPGMEPHFREAVRSFDKEAKIIQTTTNRVKLIADMDPIDVKGLRSVKDVQWTDPYLVRLIHIVDMYKVHKVKSDDHVKKQDSMGNLLDGKIILDEDARRIIIEESHSGAGYIGMDSILIDFYGKYGDVPVIFKDGTPVKSLKYRFDPNTQTQPMFNGSGYSSMVTGNNFIIFEG